MRERAGAVGGELRAGAATVGGFLVEARLPGRCEMRRMSAPAAPVRIVVADDHQIVRSGFAGLLGTQPDFTVVGTAEDGAGSGPRLPGDLPRCRADGRPHAGSGRHRGDQAADQPGPGRPRVVILTTFDLDEYVYDALRAGASGFLLKDVTAEQLFDAVRVIAAGEALLAPAVTRRLISEFARQRPRTDGSRAAGLATLTPRETQVLRLVAEGLSNPEIAARFMVTEETVKRTSAGYWPSWGCGTERRP